MFYTEIAKVLRSVDMPTFKGSVALTKRDLHAKLHTLTGQHVSDHQITQACNLNVNLGHWAEHIMRNDSRFNGYTRAKTKAEKLQEENEKLQEEVSILQTTLKEKAESNSALAKLLNDPKYAAKVLASRRKR